MTLYERKMEGSEGDDGTNITYLDFGADGGDGSGGSEIGHLRVIMVAFQDGKVCPDVEKVEVQ
ncbi:hypothetical protein BD779DRAFT_1671355 [Infundibulicybe gibba]|nr:hypothetical protein BD779DRAFT_1671355 [Infundibulicybe gibba]